MNYERIYYDFCHQRQTRNQSELSAEHRQLLDKTYKKRYETRRRLEEALGVEYVESHHIDAKSRGGGDYADNIVELTAREHFFAHLMLAAAHGGTLWGAVWAMVHEKALSARGHLPSSRMYALARENYAEALRSTVIYTWHHADHPSFTGTSYEMGKSIDRWDRTAVQYLADIGRGAKASAYGWYSKEHNPDGKVGSEFQADDARYLVRHADYGDFSGTRYEFFDFYGPDESERTHLGKLFSGDSKSVYGWYRPDINPEGVIAGSRRGGAYNGFYAQKHSEESLAKMRSGEIATLIHRDGREFTGTQTQISEWTGLDASRVSALFRKTKSSAGGWFNKAAHPDAPEQRELYRMSWRQRQQHISLHHHDGRTWAGYPVDAPVKLDTLLNGRNRHVSGWYLDSKEAKRHHEERRERAQAAADARGDISGEANPNTDHSVYEWRNLKTREVIREKRVDMWKSGRVTKGGISAIFGGRQSKTGEWELVTPIALDDPTRYRWVHKSGEVVIATCAQMLERGLTAPMTYSLLKGKTRRTLSGWSVTTQ